MQTQRHTRRARGMSIILYYRKQHEKFWKLNSKRFSEKRRHESDKGRTSGGVRAPLWLTPGNTGRHSLQLKQNNKLGWPFCRGQYEAQTVLLALRQRGNENSPAVIIFSLR
jgi:ankyrin repeat protein